MRNLKHLSKKYQIKYEPTESQSIQKLLKHSEKEDKVFIQYTKDQI